MSLLIGYSTESKLFAAFTSQVEDSRHKHANFLQLFLSNNTVAIQFVFLFFLIIE